MKAGQKEKRWMLVGLGMVLIGGVWFSLSMAGMLDGTVGLLGFSLGAGLAFSGLFVAGIYLFRWLYIQKLVSGKGVLVKWASGEDYAIISPGAAYVDGELYLWSTPDTWLEEVQIERRSYPNAEVAYLRLTLREATRARSSFSGSRLSRTKSLSIRIPPGQEEAAQRVLEELSRRKR